MDTTIETILAEERKAREEFEAAAEYGGFKIADLRKVFDKVCNALDWKAPWAASVPHQLVGMVLAAAEFFHADKAQLHGIEPITGRVRMSGRGYRA